MRDRPRSIAEAGTRPAVGRQSGREPAHVGAGGNAIGDEAVAWARDDLAFEPDRRAGHVHDQRLRLGGLPVDLERAVRCDACDRGGEGSGGACRAGRRRACRGSTTRGTPRRRCSRRGERGSARGRGANGRASPAAMTRMCVPTRSSRAGRSHRRRGSSRRRSRSRAGAKSSGTPRRLSGTARPARAIAIGASEYRSDASGRPSREATRENADSDTESKKYAPVPVRPGNDTCERASAPRHVAARYARERGTPRSA